MSEPFKIQFDSGTTPPWQVDEHGYLQCRCPDCNRTYLRSLGIAENNGALTFRLPDGTSEISIRIVEPQIVGATVFEATWMEPGKEDR